MLLYPSAQGTAPRGTGKRAAGTLKTIQENGSEQTTVNSEMSFDLDRGSEPKGSRHQINQVKD